MSLSRSALFAARLFSPDVADSFGGERSPVEGVSGWGSLRQSLRLSLSLWLGQWIETAVDGRESARLRGKERGSET